MPVKHTHKHDRVDTYWDHDGKQRCYICYCIRAEQAAERRTRKKYADILRSLGEKRAADKLMRLKSAEVG